MTLSLKVLCSDGKEYVMPVETDGEEKQIFSLDGLCFAVSRACPFEVVEYSISFSSHIELKLSEISLTIPYSGTSLGEGEKLYFDNAYGSNMFIGIKKMGDEFTEAHTRDIVAVKSDEGTLNCAFTSFDRFFTEFKIDKNAVEARWFLEDRQIEADKEYFLEKISIEEAKTEDFFERYTKSLNSRYTKRKRKPVPFGWSSWSCLYGNVTEEHVVKQISLLREYLGENSGGLIQIDDGWQGDQSFWGEWNYSREKFPSSGRYLSNLSKESGFTYGLWMAPAIVCEEAPMFKEQESLINLEGGEKKPLFINMYPLDLGNEEVISYYRGKIKQAVCDYGCEYFKLDFLANFLSRIAMDNSRPVYSGGYSVEVFKNFLGKLRGEAGDGTFMLGCGTPIGESCGIFDAVRTSSDITWDGMEGMENIKWWNVFENNIENIILRSYYDNVFITDPDGLVVRGFKTEYAKDDTALTYDEARCLATAVAMSGGHILLNEEIDRLDSARLGLFTHILPPYGKAARPADFFEYPRSTEAYIKLDEEACAVAFYNTGDTPSEKILDIQKYVKGKSAVIDMWTHDVIAVTDGEIHLSLEAHSCEAYLVKKLPEDGKVLFSDTNFWCGYSGSEEDGQREVIYSSSAPEGYMPFKNTAGLKLYIQNKY